MTASGNCHAKDIFGLLAILLFGRAPQNTNQLPEVSTVSKHVSLPDLGPASELTNTTWLNVDTPLCLADLRGKFVLIDVWTFG